MTPSPSSDTSGRSVRSTYTWRGAVAWMVVPLVVFLGARTVVADPVMNDVFDELREQAIAQHSYTLLVDGEHVPAPGTLVVVDGEEATPVRDAISQTPDGWSIEFISTSDIPLTPERAILCEGDVIVVEPGDGDLATLDSPAEGNAVLQPRTVAEGPDPSCPE